MWRNSQTSQAEKNVRERKIFLSGVSEPRDKWIYLKRIEIMQEIRPAYMYAYVRKYFMESNMNVCNHIGLVVKWACQVDRYSKRKK